MGKVIRAQRIGCSWRRRSLGHRAKGKPEHIDSIKMQERFVKGVVKEINHVPMRGTPVAKVTYENGEKSLVIAPVGLYVGDQVSYGTNAEINLGSCMYISKIPEGTQIYNVEGSPGDGGKYARSAGSTVRIVSRDANGTTIQLPSGAFKTVNNLCRANIGVAAGGGKNEKPYLKAGSKRYAKYSKGKMHSIVCGVNMSPRDHPFGGGKHPHTGKPKSVSRNAPPGRKVGAIASKRTGKLR